VAIALNLPISKVSKLYREYWDLKGLNKLNSINDELVCDSIRDFLKLCKLTNNEGTSSEHVIKLLQLVDEDNALGLSQLEK